MWELIALRTGRYLELIWIGMICLTLGFGLFIDLPAYTSWPRLIIFQIIPGIGTGVNFESPILAIQTLVQVRDIAASVSTANFVRQIAMSAGIAIGSVIFQNRMAAQRSLLVSRLGPQAGNLIADGSAGANIGIFDSLTAGQKLVAQRAYLAALRDMWILYVSVAAVGTAAGFLISKQTLSQHQEEAKVGLDAHRTAAVEDRKKPIDSEIQGAA
jgi:hypothetical protein